MASVAQRAAQLSSSGQAFFAAEAGIEEGIYSLAGHGPGYQEDISLNNFINQSTVSTTVDNLLVASIDEEESYTIEIPPNSSMAIALYYEDENEAEKKISMDNLDFELVIEDYDGNLRTDLKPDFSINYDDEEKDVDFMHPDLGKALVPSTIVLRSTSQLADWIAGSDIYQQVRDGIWCRIHEEPWTISGSSPDCGTPVQIGLGSTNLKNLKVDSYPIEAGNPVGGEDGTILDHSVYDDQASFYLDNDGNDIVSIAKVAKFFIVVENESDELNFDYELDTADFDGEEVPYSFSADLRTLSFKKVETEETATLSQIIDNVSYTKPILIVSSYTVPFSITITASYKDGDPNILPAVETSIVANGKRGNHQQKVEALLEQKENIPILHQTIVY